MILMAIRPAGAEQKHMMRNSGEKTPQEQCQPLVFKPATFPRFKNGTKILLI
jgi:hypothetical protein